MCGVAGSLGPGPEAEATGTVERMLGVLGHRGPDDRGAWSSPTPEGALALGVTRLAVRDLSERGHQPMVAAESGCAIAYNGELYNAGELRAELESAGRRFAGSSDTEVVLAAFEHWGERCVPRLRGMFALALWDPRDRTLVLARDPLGIKPLYLANLGGRLTFASELRALLAAGAERTLNRDAVAGYLATGAVTEPATIVEGVELLGAGSMLVSREGKQRTERYWDPRPLFSNGREVNAGDAAESVRAALEGAVARQLVADVPVGVFLSGGIDSSALVGLAADAGLEVTTVSVLFDDAGHSEEPYVNAVRERCGGAHHQVRLSPGSLLDALPAAFDAMDQPSVEGVNTHVVAGAARAAGLKVALSGLGGDELFAGYPHFGSVPRLHAARRRLPHLPGPLAGMAARARFGRGDRASKAARWLSGEASDAYGLARELLSPAAREALIGARGGEPPPARAADTNAISHRELTGYMRDTLLRDTDSMSMAHSLEVRVPMIDQEVVELVAGLPSHLKTGGNGTKPLLVGAVADLLPPEVRGRDKMGFTLPFERLLESELAPRVRERLLDPAHGGQAARLLDPAGVAGVWSDFERGRTSWHRPWALFALKEWSERHVPT